MRDIRERLLDALAEYGRYRPQMRLGQSLLAIMASGEYPHSEEDVYGADDEELLSALERILVRYRNTDWASEVVLPSPKYGLPGFDAEPASEVAATNAVRSFTADAVR
jgi:hypothetical protein